ncbi:CaiB/BaiF CoA transferase family protein [Allorhizocola rhizosphaerae]|uniref:CaiB/BaiF CoA transferase family protein n=1 Tax=Allorhizocola rhizosphaerae TaxID=1872709 RepID=UPI001B8AA969|nr:CaiB/BaiF CoA-transferase family protein [Allorhizocola rhizosphaerae]
MHGPLHGVTVLEIAAIGPAPFGCMLLADLGATVIRVDRPGERQLAPWHRILDRGRRSISLDLKHPAGVEVVLRLAERADVMVEGFRPGVAERLGIGPIDCRRRNPALVYARMTGWGQSGPLARTAGHDINYIALSGALHAIGRAGGGPVPPLNLLGDFAAGGMLLVNGVLAALLERERSGVGQVIDVSIVDGTASLLSMLLSMSAAGQWRDERGTNILDTGAPFYDVYACAGGGHVAVGAIEDQFYLALVTGLGLDPELLPDRTDPVNWSALKRLFADRFASRTRDEWAAIFAETDACVTPVLTVAEAAQHPHLVARETYVEGQPAGAPRFSRSRAMPAKPAPEVGDDTLALLADCGLSQDEIARLERAGAVWSNDTRPEGE